MASPEYHRRKSREWREQHKARGHCSRCGDKREPGRKSVCADCVRIMMIKIAARVNAGQSTQASAS